MIDPRPYAALCRDAYTSAPDIAVGDIVRAIVRPTPGGRCVAFQGTHTPHQVLADLDVGPQEISGLGHVHRGFWQAMLSAAIQVDVANAGHRLILTGHSLGGALAIALCVHRALMGKPPAAIITFGAPHVGIGSALGAVLDGAGVHRQFYRNGIDCVPELPPHIPLIARWQHPGPLIAVGHPGDPVEDHEITRYCAALDAAFSAA